MHSATLSQIQEMIRRLSREEQFWLIEQPAHHPREGMAKGDIFVKTAFESQLAA